MSSSAPFATSASSTGGDEQKGGRRKYDSSSQRSDAPFATNYPETSDIDFRDQEGTPSSKHGGRRRYDDQDAAHEAPFAIASGEPMFEEPPHAPAENNNAAPAAGQTGRPQPIKPSDNRDVFRYDQSASEEEASRSGRRRYQQEKHDAPFATSGGAEADRNGGSSVSGGGSDTPRSAGGRRRFEDKLQKKPAPFALDDGERQVWHEPGCCMPSR